MTTDSIDISNITKSMRRHGYHVFDKDVTPYNLNIVAIRSNTPVVNKFNDKLVVFWYYNNDIYEFRATVTTLPGRYYLIDKLLNPKGAAILKPGQYVNAYRIGPHRGKYEALIQAKKLPVYRDGNRDECYDYDPATECNGYFGINIHRASKYDSVPKVGRNSAGCIVIQDPQKFAELMRICIEATKHYENSFTLTLLEERDLDIS